MKHPGGRPRISEFRREKLSVSMDPRIKAELEKFAQTNEGGGTISSAIESVLQAGFAAIKDNSNPPRVKYFYSPPFEVKQ
jgi:hypothetical protein